jgi:hypothetical protein
VYVSDDSHNNQQLRPVTKLGCSVLQLLAAANVFGVR